MVTQERAESSAEIKKRHFIGLLRVGHARTGTCNTYNNLSTQLPEGTIPPNTSSTLGVFTMPGFDLTEQNIAKLPPEIQAEVKAMLGIKQAMYDVLGSYPLDNVLPYAYGFILSANTDNEVPANSTVQTSIKISADAAFIGNSIRGASIGDFLTFMRIDSSDRQLQNIAVHSTALVGTAERPGPLHKPLMLQANTTISFDITDISGSDNDVFFYIFGFKVYQRRTMG